jgi:hypothetical protein
MSRASRVSTDAARDAQSATSDTAAAQLRRLLHVIPRIADGQEHPIARLARIAGVEDNRQLIADLESLVDRFDMLGGFVEGVQVWIDSKTVSVVSDHFRRPMDSRCRSCARCNSASRCFGQSVHHRNTLSSSVHSSVFARS